MGSYTKVHSEKLGDGHSPPGPEACSPGKFLCSEISSGEFWQHKFWNWITGIAGNNRVEFVAK